jgi:hypothetical protein
MEGSQPGKGIDPQMVRDHGGDLETLEKEIRHIELEALAMQARLVQHHDVPKSQRPHRGWRRAR